MTIAFDWDVKHQTKKTNCVDNSKGSRSQRKHLQNVTNANKSTANNLPDEPIIKNESIADSKNVAKNKYIFSSIADILNENRSIINPCDLDTESIKKYFVSKVPKNM